MTVAFSNPAIPTISPASPLSIGMRLSPLAATTLKTLAGMKGNQHFVFLLQILFVPVSIKFPFKSRAFNLVPTTTEPDTIRPVRIRPKYWSDSRAEAKNENLGCCTTLGGLTGENDEKMVSK